MIFLEAFGSVLIGFAMALAAVRRLPDRFPSRPLTLGTGPVGALFGTLLAHAVLGPGHAIATLIAGAALGVALLSLLLRPASRVRRSVTA
ncbi:hypothetical protein AB0I22_03275 [Streptomyces sp. NPDC050610]|uniref:hypothetical protein n=1 Tax=Streptomyces sp. NPDC050610 TaxID=3157097 RepID=UPI00341F0731